MVWQSEGIPGFYRGFATVVFGTIPARTIYLTSLEITKSAMHRHNAEVCGRQARQMVTSPSAQCRGERQGKLSRLSLPTRVAWVKETKPNQSDLEKVNNTESMNHSNPGTPNTPGDHSKRNTEIGGLFMCL
eukprot:scaffold233002_cov19-Tisochrysis_lutea.AAC.2